MSSDHLFQLVHDELRKIASRELKREKPGHTLNTDALINEAYLALKSREFESKAHFLAYAATAMRNILRMWWRRKQAEKHGGGWKKEPDFVVENKTAQDFLNYSNRSQPSFLALDAALEKLAENRPRAARVVELRYFAGMTIPEVAQVVGVVPRTIDNDWKIAKAWIKADLRKDGESGPTGIG